MINTQDGRPAHPTSRDGKRAVPVPSGIPAYSRTLRIEPGFVLRRLALATGLGAIPLLWLLSRTHGVDPLLAVGTASAGVFLLLLLPRFLWWGTRQGIQLHPDRIVFDTVTQTQEYAFASPAEWRIDADRGYWRLASAEGQVIRYVPKAAYPHLKYVAQQFYAPAEAARAAQRILHRRHLRPGPRRAMRAATPWLRLVSPQRHGHRHRSPV